MKHISNSQAFVQALIAAQDSIEYMKGDVTIRHHGVAPQLTREDWNDEYYDVVLLSDHGTRVTYVGYRWDNDEAGVWEYDSGEEDAAEEKYQELCSELDKDMERRESDFDAHILEAGGAAFDLTDAVERTRNDLVAARAERIGLVNSIDTFHHISTWDVVLRGADEEPSMTSLSPQIRPPSGAEGSSANLVS